MEKLDREMLFAIVADAAFQDGQLEAYEKQILEQLTGFLKLDSGLAMAIARQAKQRYAEGKLGPATRLDGEAVYFRCLQVALADGMLEDDEETLLKAMRGLFKVSSTRHEELLGRARKSQAGVAPPASASRPAGEESLPASAAATRSALDAQAASILSSLEANPEGYKPSEEQLHGKKLSTVTQRFRLRAGGLPVPFWANMLMAGLAGALLLGSTVVSQAVLPDRFPTTRTRVGRSQPTPTPHRGRPRSGPRTIAFGLFTLLSGAAYWQMRLRFESALIGEGAEIRVSEGNLTLPGSLRLGGSEELRLSKAGVDRIDLGVSDKGMICSLTFALKDGPTLRFGAGSIENPAALATALGEHFGVPANKQTYSFYANHLETLLAGGLALLGVAVVYALFL